MLHKPIYINDDKLYKFVNCTDHDIKQCGLKHGIIVFKFENKQCVDTIDFIQHLQLFDHCAMFSFKNYDYDYACDEDDDTRTHLRIIDDSDLPKFKMNNGIYHYGTLCHVGMVKKGKNFLCYLTFDTENG